MNNFQKEWRSEDWLAVWIGFAIIFVGSFAVLTGSFDFSALKFSTWGFGEDDKATLSSLASQLSGIGFWRSLLMTVVVLGGLFTFGIKARGQSTRTYLPAFLGLFVLAFIVRLISAEYTLNRYLEWAFWALLAGLLVSNTIGTPRWMKPAVKTEFYIKTGLVIMGFSVLFSNIAKFGLYGLGIAWIVTPVVILFMWWFGKYSKSATSLWSSLWPPPLPSAEQVQRLQPEQPANAKRKTSLWLSPFPSFSPF